MDLATLDEGRLASVTSHRRVQRLAAIRDVKARRREVQAAVYQFAQQRVHYRRILGRSLADAQHRFTPIAANPKGYDHLPVLERSPVDQHGAQPQFTQRALHQFLYLFSAGLDEVVAYR